MRRDIGSTGRECTAATCRRLVTRRRRRSRAVQHRRKSLKAFPLAETEHIPYNAHARTRRSRCSRVTDNFTRQAASTPPPVEADSSHSIVPPTPTMPAFSRSPHQSRLAVSPRSINLTAPTTKTYASDPPSVQGRFTVAFFQNGVENQSKTCRFGAALGPLFSPLNYRPKIVNTTNTVTYAKSHKTSRRQTLFFTPLPRQPRRPAG